MNGALASFSKREWTFFIIFFATLCVSTLLLLNTINQFFMVDTPARGGSISEGMVGTPRFVNPILATSLADQSVTTLVYSGLMRKNSEGVLVPDLAEKYEISEDGHMYTFTLKDNLKFHDGEPLTTSDILFTINKAKDPIIKSAQKPNWDTVTVELIDDKNIAFTLKQTGASFLENTTLGILPEHIWGDSPVELHERNTNPVGSGPYLIKKVGKHSSGTIESYELSAFENFALGEPYITNITLRFYQNEEELVSAFREGKVRQISSISPKSADELKDEGARIEYAILPRVFGLFFNQNHNQLFTDKAVAKAISQAVDKESIVREVLSGYGVAIDDPIPPSMLEYQKMARPNNTDRSELLEQILSDLEKAGWKKNQEGFLEKTITDKNKKSTTPLEFSIFTSNAPELAKTAELIQKNLMDIGMRVDVKTFEAGNLNQNVIRPREYDVLLFGQIINRESDLYVFWHSSQRKDPGLNIASYTNARVDKILEDASTTTNPETRREKYIQFEQEIRKDMPAVFLYSPKFIYVVSPEVRNVSLLHTTNPSDRFLNIHSWYLNIEKVWQIFVD